MKIIVKTVVCLLLLSMSFVVLFSTDGIATRYVPKAVITDLDRNIVDKPEVLAKVYEVLESGISKEEKTTLLKAICSKYEIDIVVIDPTYLND